MAQANYSESELPSWYSSTITRQLNGTFLRPDNGVTKTKKLSFMNSIKQIRITHFNGKKFAAGSEFLIYAVRA